LFLAFVEYLRASARENYHVEMIVWALTAPHRKHPGRPPDIPSILR